jgi:VanZ family protein
VSARVSAWAPAGVWAGVIFLMSTDTLSAAHTRDVFEPILRFLFPSLSPEAFELLHAHARKLAHVSEYLVFALLLDRGFRRDSPLAPSRAPLAALAVAAFYSLTDEGHQAFVDSRTPSLYDCGFDSFGAAIGAICAAFFSAARGGRS